MPTVKDVELLHVMANFNRSGVELKNERRKLSKFRNYFRRDVQRLGGGVSAALHVLDMLTRLYDEEGVPSAYVLSVQYPHAQTLITGAKKIELRKQPPTSPFTLDSAQGARVLLAQSKSKSKLVPHERAEYGGRQDGRILGQITIAGFLPIEETDLDEGLARECQLCLPSLQAAWAQGYRFGWIMEDPLSFSQPPATYTHTSTEGTRMGTIFTRTVQPPVKRARRI
jgi:hypothetical protein